MKRILLVEDHEQLRSLLKIVLKEERYEVEEAENGRTALEKFAAQTFNLVITDIVMRDIEGLELIKKIKHLDTEVKIIAMSGGGTNNSIDYLRLAKFMGADFVIDKPFEIPNFIDLVSKALV